MKVILDITQDNRIDFFMDLVGSLDYIAVVKQVKPETKSQLLTDLADAFKDVKLFEQGNKKLKSAKHLLNQL